MGLFSKIADIGEDVGTGIAKPFERAGREFVSASKAEGRRILSARNIFRAIAGGRSQTIDPVIQRALQRKARTGDPLTPAEHEAAFRAGLIISHSTGQPRIGIDLTDTGIRETGKTAILGAFDSDELAKSDAAKANWIDLGSPAYGPEGAPLPVLKDILGPRLSTLPFVATLPVTGPLGATGRAGAIRGAALIGGSLAGSRTSGLVGREIAGEEGEIIAELAGLLGGSVAAGVVSTRLTRAAGTLPGEGKAAALGASEAGEAGKFPTLRQVEAQAAGPKLPPEVRAKMVPDTPPGTYKPANYQGLTETVLGGADKKQLAFWQRVARLPGGRQIVGFVNKRALAETDPVLMSRIKHAIYVENEGGAAAHAINRWRKDLGVLGLDGKGFARGVEVRPGATIPKGLQGHFGHIVEHPEKYILTAEQGRVIDDAKQILDSVVKAELENGVNVRLVFLEGDAAYFPRAVVKSGNEKAAGAYVRRAVGSKQAHTLGRVFGDIEDGARSGLQYESDPVVLMRARVHAGIRSIADENALRELTTLGLKPSERIPQALRDAVNDARARLKATKAAGDTAGFEVARRDFAQARRALKAAGERARRPGIGEIFGPRNRIFPRELAEELSEFLIPGARRSVAESALLPATQLIRAFKTTADFSATMVQGGLLLFRNPVAWSKATAYGVASFVADPLAYVSRNYAVMEEGIRLGAIMRPTEFLFAERGLASLPLRVPIIGSAFRGFNRSFEWFVVVGQTEMWKAVRLTARNSDEMAALAAVVRKELGTLSDAALGLGRTQRAIESLALFAPRFFRANLGLISDVAQGGVRRREALRALGSMLAGATAVTIGANYALNGKLPNLDDPNKADWLSINTPKGRVNLFGPFYPFMRAAARTATTGDPKHLEMFLRSKAGIPFSIMRDVIAAQQGETVNVFGDPLPVTEEQTAEFIARQFFPIGVEQAVEGVRKGQLEATGEIFGLRTTPKLPPALFREEADIKAQDLGYSSWADVPKGERADVLRTDAGLRELDEARQAFFDKHRGKMSAEEFAFQDIKKSRELHETTLLGLWKGVEAGNVTVADWRAAFGDLMGKHAWLSMTLLDGQDSDPKRRSNETLQDYYARIFHAIQPENFAGLPGADPTPAAWKRWREARDAFWTRFPEAEQFRDYILLTYPTRNWTDPRMAELHRTYIAAQRSYDEFLRLPAYRGMSVEDGDFIDSIRGLADRVSREIRFALAERGADLSRIRVPALLAWRLALQQLQTKPLTEHQYKLIRIAIIMDLKPQARRRLLNADRARFLMENPTLVEWYPGSIQQAGLRDQDAARLGLLGAPLGESVGERVGVL